MGYSEVCCLILKYLEIFKLSYCYWVRIKYCSDHRTYSYHFDPLQFTKTCLLDQLWTILVNGPLHLGRMCVSLLWVIVFYKTISGQVVDIVVQIFHMLSNFFCLFCWLPREGCYIYNSGSVSLFTSFLIHIFGNLVIGFTDI